jgi:hypothetical protein
MEQFLKMCFLRVVSPFRKFRNSEEHNYTRDVPGLPRGGLHRLSKQLKVE